MWPVVDRNVVMRLMTIYEVKILVNRHRLDGNKFEENSVQIS